MIPNSQPFVAVFADGTTTPVAAWNPKGRAMIPTPAGDLVIAAQQPRFQHVTTKEN